MKLTIIKIRNAFQHMAARVESLWSTNSARSVLARERDDLGIDERPRRDALVQCLTEGKCGGHLVACVAGRSLSWWDMAVRSCESMTFHVQKNKTHYTQVSSRMSRAGRPHLARYTRLPLLIRIPRFLLGEVPGHGLDRADSRGSVALIFVLFRGSFEGNTAIFLAVGRAAGLSETSAKTFPNLDPPKPMYPGINIVIDTGFRGTSSFSASSVKANICPAATSIMLN